MISSSKMAVNTTTAGGNDPTQAKYFHVARVVINGSYNRVAFKFDYIGTGTTPKMGVIEGYVYSTSSYDTISIQSFVQAYTKDKSPFLSTDIKVVKATSASQNDLGYIRLAIGLWYCIYETDYIHLLNQVNLLLIQETENYC